LASAIASLSGLAATPVAALRFASSLLLIFDVHRFIFIVYFLFLSTLLAVILPKRNENKIKNFSSPFLYLKEIFS
jgi:hypothetical protein